MRRSKQGTHGRRLGGDQAASGRGSPSRCSFAVVDPPAAEFLPGRRRGATAAEVPRFTRLGTLRASCGHGADRPQKLGEHHAARRRGGGLAAYRAGAAAGQTPSHRDLWPNPLAASGAYGTRRTCPPISWMFAFGGDLQQALQQLGWTIGRIVRIDYRWAAGDADRTRRYAAELVALAPDVILAAGGTMVGPMLQVTRTVPIVFTLAPDPSPCPALGRKSGAMVIATPKGSRLMRVQAGCGPRAWPDGR